MDFDVPIYLHEIGPNRLEVFAYLRSLLGLSLSEVAKLEASLPIIVAEGARIDVGAVQARLKSLGCTIKYGP